jgi:lipopolysaccharide export system protein LptC
VLVILLLTAAVSGWWAWQLRDDDEPPALVGPPRSDYLLFDFDLIALDGAGKESFAASGPRLSRHPHLGTLDIEQPRFSSPDESGAVWTSRADRAWVNAEGSELRLLGDAQIRGPAATDVDPLLMRSESLVLFPRLHKVESALPVTITEPGSILTATGLRGDLNARRVELLSDVRIQHDPPAP